MVRTADCLVSAILALVTDCVSPANPFSKRETHSQQSITTYKVLTILTWLAAVVVSVYYVFFQPGLDNHDPKHPGDIHEHQPRTIWQRNKEWPTGFTLNPIITSIYW